MNPYNSPQHGHGHGHGQPPRHGGGGGGMHMQQGPPPPGGYGGGGPSGGAYGAPAPMPMAPSGGGGGGPFRNLLANWSTQIQVALKNNTFYPGNIVEGVVTVSTSTPIPFSAIRLKFTGKEKVHIQRNERIPDGPPRPPANGQGPPVQHYKTIKRSYYSTNVFLKQLITLSGNLKYSAPYGGQTGYQLMPGNYSYPFAFELPYNLPPSFNRTVSDDTANIIYYAKAYVDIPMGRDAMSKCFFSVVRPMPASQWASRGPASVTRNYDVTCCCCISKGVVNATISMDRTCIAIDRDWLQLFADLDNTQCKEPIENLVFTLRHSLRYKAGGFSEGSSYAAGSKVLGDKIMPGQKGLVNGVIDLPRNLMPSFKTPNVESSYVMCISMTIPWADDPVQSFPVVIGQSVDDSNVSPPIPFNDIGSVAYNPPRAPCPEYYYQPPTSACYAFAPIMLSNGPPVMNGWTGGNNNQQYNQMQQNQQQPYNYTYMPIPSSNEYCLPPQSWSQPPAVYYDPENQGHQQQQQYYQQQQQQQGSMQWQSGYDQQYAPEYQMAPPPTQPMGYGQPNYNNGGNAYGKSDPSMALPNQSGGGLHSPSGATPMAI